MSMPLACTNMVPCCAMSVSVTGLLLDADGYDYRDGRSAAMRCAAGVDLISVPRALRLAWRHQSVFQREEAELRTIGRPGLGVDVLDVTASRLRGYPQPIRDCSGGQTLSQ